jgi:serine/threonine protein kinase
VSEPPKSPGPPAPKATPKTGAPGVTSSGPPSNPTLPSISLPRPTASADALIGTVLADRYEIIRRIGEGGMGAVYEGRHVVLRRQVAVKVLLEKFLEKTELVARLLQEARLASAIGHENIVDVTDFGTTVDGRAFVVMEFLEGEALAALVMRDAPLAVERCLRIVRQVVSALGAAHGKGIVHRDVKPENVFLLRRGEQDVVKVVDFGVSKAVRSREDGAELLRLTRTGMVLGTPLYMSPEQARGNEDVDARADIWAVGVMMYECLTGEVPFRANNYLGVISQVLTQEIQPPSQLRPELGIPPAVEAVVMRAMAKDRDDRYQDMPALERDIDRLLAGDPNVGLREAPVSTPSLPRQRARWHLVIAAIVVVGIGLSLALVRTEEERRKIAATAPVTTPEPRAVTSPEPSAAAAAPAQPMPPPTSAGNESVAALVGDAGAHGEDGALAAVAVPVVDGGDVPAPAHASTRPGSLGGASARRRGSGSARAATAPASSRAGDRAEFSGGDGILPLDQVFRAESRPDAGRASPPR